MMCGVSLPRGLARFATELTHFTTREVDWSQIAGDLGPLERISACRKKLISGPAQSGESRDANNLFRAIERSLE